VSQKNTHAAFFDLEGGSQKATLVVLVVVVVVISSLKILKAFFIRRSGAQRNFAYMHIRADIPHNTIRIRFSTYFLINE